MRSSSISSKCSAAAAVDPNHHLQISPGIPQLVAALKASGKQVFLVSGGFRLVIHPIAEVGMLNVCSFGLFFSRLASVPSSAPSPRCACHVVRPFLSAAGLSIAVAMAETDNCAAEEQGRVGCRFAASVGPCLWPAAVTCSLCGELPTMCVHL